LSITFTTASYHYGEIDVEIEKMRSNGSGSSKILAALYCQIKFHKEILQSKGPKELFLFSR
jgi:hypothetical protein